jgi:hypothetical protein
VGVGLARAVVVLVQRWRHAVHALTRSSSPGSVATPNGVRRTRRYSP